MIFLRIVKFYKEMNTMDGFNDNNEDNGQLSFWDDILKFIY